MDKLIKKALILTFLTGLTMVKASFICRHNVAAAANIPFAFNNKGTASSETDEDHTPGELTGYTASGEKEAQLIAWQSIRDVTYEVRYNEQLKSKVQYPDFGKNVKSLAGKRLRITGYMIPLDINSGLYAVSRYPYASCFFCGAAGVETVISLKFKSKPRRFKTDEYLTIEGTFELNDTNVNDFIYIFRNAEEVRD